MAAFTKLEVKLISHTTKLQVHAKLSNEIPNKKKSKAKQESAKSTVPVNKTVKQRQK